MSKIFFFSSSSLIPYFLLNVYSFLKDPLSFLLEGSQHLPAQSVEIGFFESHCLSSESKAYLKLIPCVTKTHLLQAIRLPDGRVDL